MEKSDRIPSLPELALQYGTISKEQFTHLHRLHSIKRSEDKTIDFTQLILSEKFATEYQLGLLILIREYLIIKKRGEEFGKIAIQKGFATQQDVDKALEHQKQEFKRAKLRKLIGDILVESRVLTIKQKNTILKEQISRDRQAEEIFASEPPDEADVLIETPGDKEIDLSDYEKKFLKIQVLDQEFAACAHEKGLVTEHEIKIAQKIQEDEFEKKFEIRILGDIMVDLDFLTDDQKIQILVEQERTSKSGKESGGIRITISQDNMEAVVTMPEDTELIRCQDIKRALELNGIQYGFYPDAILQCNLDMKNPQFIAARQDFSLELIKNRKITYYFDTDGIDPQIQKKGAALAEQHFSNEPYLKKDLFGKTIEHPGASEPGIRCGTGARLSKDRTKAFAGRTGFPSLSIEGKLYIHPVINVLEDADLRYGPLEKFASLNISGVLTGAYPVSAGNIDAEEIRGARIEAIGSVRSRVGMTDAVIIAQGDIHARYLHNCRIETFGNVYVKNEIIDSQIFCSGKIDSGQCRAITSSLYAKKGVELAGAGNKRTGGACTIGTGTEHHILERTRRIHLEIQNIQQQLDALKEKENEQRRYAKKIFQKMIERKIFHDRAKKKKKKLSEKFQNQKKSYPKEKLKNLATLIHSFETRMKSSIASLKELNERKKEHEKQKLLIEKKIKKLEPKIKNEISKLQLDLFSFLEWTRKQNSIPQIKINKTVYPGTIFKGIFKSIVMERSLDNFSVIEKHVSKNKSEMVIEKSIEK